ncbi:CHAT domain-containing protein [Sorangium sp. So ce131]|uniref:CHAT domain-containing protein n=1 Tax=Sorangium sp. So ce131 TaxID=3133282 RepID=UPI003F646B06
MPAQRNGPCAFQGTAGEVEVRGVGAAVLLEKEAFSAGRVQLSPAQIGDSERVVRLDHPDLLWPVRMNRTGARFAVTYKAGPPTAVTIAEGGGDRGDFRGKLDRAPRCAVERCDVIWFESPGGKKIQLEYDGARPVKLVDKMPSGRAVLEGVVLRDVRGTLSCSDTQVTLEGDWRWAGGGLTLEWIEIHEKGLGVRVLDDVPPEALGPLDAGSNSDAGGAPGKTGTSTSLLNDGPHAPVAWLAAPAIGTAALVAGALLWWRSRRGRSRLAPATSREDSAAAPLWMEIEIEPAGAELRVVARGSRGERPAPRTLGSAVSVARLQGFARDVGRAVEAREHLDAHTLGEAQALHEALFQGELRDVATRLEAAATDRKQPLLQRLLIRDARLQAVPWEALCEPGTSEGFWGSSPRVRLARGVSSARPSAPRAVRGAVRVLAIAPEGDVGSLYAALADSIEAGEVAWLDPITGARTGRRYLFEQLRKGERPHVIHFIGHGGIDEHGHPVLRLHGDEGDEAAWTRVESLASELAARFGEDLRLVVLEACELSRPGAFGSAAELLARAGADAVVAHLWRVAADIAHDCSRELYRTLTAATGTAGDVVATMAAVRRTLLLGGAPAFSPVLYLRGAGEVLFDFSGREVRPAGGYKSRANDSGD